MEPAESFFPHDSVRKVQSDLISDVVLALGNGKDLIAHAPTGLGKTAATLSPALSYALREKKVVFFLTSRHTQHLIAVNTLKEIRKRHNLDFVAVDLIGKRHMCSQDVELLYQNEFMEYCRSLVKDNKCIYFANARSKAKPSVLAEKVLAELRILNPLHTEELCKVCSSNKLCAYELSCMLARSASVIIADYSYIFNPSIQSQFFAKAGISLGHCIIIVDEAHNLPRRIRDQMTQQISTFTLRRAFSEAEKFGYDELAVAISSISSTLLSLGSSLGENKERLLAKGEFVEELKKLGGYDELIAALEFAADDIREKQKISFIGSLASFLDAWQGPDNGFVRILSLIGAKREPITSLSYKCLDPSIVSSGIIGAAHSTILMSGTLTPTSMFRDILGFNNNTIEREYPNPFPEKNCLNMIIPVTTTKFSKRSKEQYRKIAGLCAELVNIVPGNSLLFFPSYELRNEVNFFFKDLCTKQVLLETPRLSKEEKAKLLEQFKELKDSGAVLLAVASGSFGEGIDLPGDYLKAVIVVGIPLTKPDLETQELIHYYDDKFNRGLDYGYLLPAITRSLQNAGRCIRSEADKGIRIFLDERYSWQNYRRCFPKDWRIITTKLYKERISKFFADHAH